MATKDAAKKAARQALRRRLRNRSVKSAVKRVVRNAEEAIEDGEKGEAKVAVLSAIAALDRAAKKTVIHPRNAARSKSRLMKKLSALEARGSK